MKGDGFGEMLNEALMAKGARRIVAKEVDIRPKSGQRNSKAMIRKERNVY